MSDRHFCTKIGIGATNDLSLRVSVATLGRLLFPHPREGTTMLALERKATLRQTATGGVVGVKSQPFGGALRIHDLRSLQNIISDFHFDSEESRTEQDFRIFIRPADREAVREFCIRQFGQPNDSVLESDPTRELMEEFADALGIQLERDQYRHQVQGIIIEDQPTPTENPHARGYPTARMYRIFEARILDPSLATAMIKNSKSWSDQDLRELALQNFRNGGSGRANAVLTLPLREINDFYLAVATEARNMPVFFHTHQLDETVAAVLDDVTVPKYRRL